MSDKEEDCFVKVNILDPYFGSTEECKEFDDACAVAHMLADEVLIIGHLVVPKDGVIPEQAALSVLANDVWVWACSYYVPLPVDQIEPLYKMFLESSGWGCTKWCCIRNGRQPQPPVKKAMIADGVWCDELEALEANPNGTFN